MLKRITNLKNIGRFRNASCGGIEFRQISIIFGRNTYGKTTLGDVLSSIESRDLSAVISRRSIPDDNRPQEATLNFVPLGQTSETAISLLPTQWNPSLPNTQGS
jgi:wobble nucleotide-excising tRNase